MAIARGDCEAALVGGTNLIISPGLTSLLSTQGVLSRDGSCKTFSAEADGYARGEALVAIYVKPLGSALRDGNPIRAVIRATGTNHDGKTQGISKPSSEAQEALIRHTYRAASISDFGETAMVECHGTGTPTGDPIETKAVSNVFGQTGVFIGSVKPNVGHSEGASGLTSLLKMVMALEHRTIPPNIKFMTPNPNIPFQQGKLTVPTDPTPWPQDKLERVSINCFGVGGTNCHVILESAHSFISQSIPSPVISPQLLLYSATTSKSLAQLSSRYQNWLSTNCSKVEDLASTLAHHRTHLPLRMFAIAQGAAIQSYQQSVKSTSKNRLVMVFTGQGAQWAQMASEIFQSQEVFRSTIRSLDQHLNLITYGSVSYSLAEELLKAPEDSRLSSAAISQPLCTAIQIALVDTFRSIDIHPCAVVGHSSGEIAAAYAAGALSASEAVTVAHYRGVVAESQKKVGAMAAIGLGYEQTDRYLRPGVRIACHNSPTSVTISGDAAAVHDVVADIQYSVKGVSIRVLPVDKAYHSAHMAEIGAKYRLMIKDKIRPNKPRVQFFSSVTGDSIKGGKPLDAEYWKDNLELPVMFNGALSSILRELGRQNTVFLEIGPHSVLAGPIKQICRAHSASHHYIASMVKYRDTAVSFLTAVGTLYCLGVTLNLEAIIPRRRCLPDLPRYPWNHEQRYWAESRVSKEWRLKKDKHHNLLGSRVPESTELEPSWRNLFNIQSVPWMRDHRVGENIVFPFTAYLSMAGEAVRQVNGAKNGYSIRDLTVDVALVLDEGSTTEVITTLRPYYLTKSQESGWWDFTIASFNDHVWTRHAKGQVTALMSNLPQLPSSDNPLPKKVDSQALYKGMQRVGVNLGTSFQTMSLIEASTSSDHLARANVAVGQFGDEADYHVHPTTLDVIFQLQSVAAVKGRLRLLRNWIPVSLERLNVLRCDMPIVGILSSEITSNGSLFGQGHCISSVGNTVVEFSGVRLSPADGLTSNEKLDTHGAARLEWAPSLDFMLETDLVRSGGGQGKLCHLNFLQHLSHLQPNLRILELGTDDESVLKEIREHVNISNGSILFSTYTSIASSSRASGDLDLTANEVEYTSLGINQDLENQDLENREFDFIMVRAKMVLFNQVHVVLRNLEKILSPDGWVFFEEVPEPWREMFKFGASRQNGHHNYHESVELFSESPATRLSRGSAVLLSFSDLQSSTRAVKMYTSTSSTARELTFLRLDITAAPTALIEYFQDEGYEVKQCTLADRLPPGTEIISLLDEDQPFLKNMSDQSYTSLNNFLQMLQDSGLVWVTRHAQMGCADPNYSQIIGLARTLRSEMQLDFATCEVDSFDFRPELIAGIFERFRTRRRSEMLKPDFEYAIKDGVIHVGRYHPFSLKDQLMLSSPKDRTVLDVDIPGRLNSLQWMKVPREELRPLDVEIEARSVGLNFKDVVVAMGMVELPSREFGLEAAGVVTRIGADVSTVKIGDRVCCLSSQCFSSVIVAPENLCMPMPDGLKFIEAATMIIPFATAIWSLINIGRLQKNQSILIHSACGGVGLAAIQVAKALGAEIFATVGTEEKISFLVDHYQITRDRIFDSRSDSFVAGVMRETGNLGVDLVLNSLSGDLLHTSWQCVAEFGTMIELGKRDLLNHGKLDMRPFLDNRTYSCVGIDHLLKRSHIMKNLFHSIFEFYEKGQIKPIHPIREFEASQIHNAFQTMQKGLHIGRFGVSMTAIADWSARPRFDTPRFDGNGSYLLVGGLGGIGRALSSYMAELGARELIYLSRNAGLNSADTDLSTELQSLGCDAIFVKGDVCDLDTVSSTLLRATKPLKGIIQLSMVLRDQNFSDMTFEQWTQAAAPKIQGTWNLHHATVSAGIELDFFMLCSSISGQIGQPGQANYASANTFLDAFAQYRSGLGLPAAVVDIGAVEDIGVLAHAPGLLNRMKAGGLRAVNEQEVLDGLVYAMSRPKQPDLSEAVGGRYSYQNGFLIGLGPVLPPMVRNRDRRMAVYSNDGNDEKEGPSSNEPLKDLLSRADADPAILKTDEAAQLLSIEIGKQIADMLLLQSDYDITNTNVLLTDLGMDSLVAVELRAWWRQVFRLEISVREMLGKRSLAALGKFAADGLLKARGR
ncbi:acyl transferase domain-containing protein [Xylariaceae sp. FL0255]|nr:acyl transferase domain-containing protein [Xylariaceae sp. FL0255]